MSLQSMAYPSNSAHLLTCCVCAMKFCFHERIACHICDHIMAMNPSVYEEGLVLRRPHCSKHVWSAAVKPSLAGNHVCTSSIFSCLHPSKHESLISNLLLLCCRRPWSAAAVHVMGSSTSTHWQCTCPQWCKVLHGCPAGTVMQKNLMKKSLISCPHIKPS